MNLRSSSGTKDMRSTLLPNCHPSVLERSFALPSPPISASPSPGRRRAASRSPPAATKGAVDQEFPSSGAPFAVTYTPTTHRISKAKKGKRVHACEYPGCNKVFTRAEHRRRHELNHNPDAFFRCTHHGCEKAFRRSDLLARHAERHALEVKEDWEQPIQTTNIHPGITVDPSSKPFLAPTQPPASVPTGSPMASSNHSEPATNPLLWSAADMPLQHNSIVHYHAQESAGGSPFYSSPETCTSPVSDGAALSVSPNIQPSAPLTPGAAIEPFPVETVGSDVMPSPMQTHTSLRCWDPCEMGMPGIVIGLDGELIHPNIQCSYSPDWMPAGNAPYGDHSSEMGWKTWSY